MKDELLEILWCPTCLRKLTGLPEGKTIVCENCKTRYLVVDGLPIILESRHLEELRETKKSFGLQWEWQNEGKFEEDTIYGKTQKEELGDFLKIFNIQSPQELAGKKILDAGCGLGRLTQALGEYAPRAMVVGIDLSNSAKISLDKCGS